MRIAAERLTLYAQGGSRIMAELYAQQANAAGARVAVIGAERALQAATMDLVRVLMLDLLGSYEFQTPEGVEIPAAPLASETLLTAALAGSADVQAAQARVERAERSARVARSGYWPQLSLGAGYNSAYTDASLLALQEQFELNRRSSVS